MNENIELEQEVRTRIALLTSDLDLHDAASAELLKRLVHLNRALPPRTRSRADKWPNGRKPSLRREAHPVEALIVMAIARTSGAAQFGASPNGAVFTADTDGYSGYNGRRDVLTGISPLLDEVAIKFNKWKRDGEGGRFYLRDGTFFDAEDGDPFLRVDVREDASDYSGRMSFSGRRSASVVDGVMRSEASETIGAATPSSTNGTGVWQRILNIFRS